jgi:hypothetical protein
MPTKRPIINGAIVSRQRSIVRSLSVVTGALKPW